MPNQPPQSNAATIDRIMRSDNMPSRCHLQSTGPPSGDRQASEFSAIFHTIPVRMQRRAQRQETPGVDPRPGKRQPPWLQGWRQRRPGGSAGTQPGRTIGTVYRTGLRVRSIWPIPCLPFPGDLTGFGYGPQGIARLVADCRDHTRRTGGWRNAFSMHRSGYER